MHHFEMFAKSANCKTGIAEIFGQVVPHMWASHAKRLPAKRDVAAWYSTETTSG